MFLILHFCKSINKITYANPLCHTYYVPQTPVVDTLIRQSNLSILPLCPTNHSSRPYVRHTHCLMHQADHNGPFCSTNQIFLLRSTCHYKRQDTFDKPSLLKHKFRPTIIYVMSLALYNLYTNVYNLYMYF